MLDIEHHMLHFLDNHDEQRVAHPEFAGDAELGRPAMLVSALLSSAPTMIYFGQEVGEPGFEDAALVNQAAPLSLTTSVFRITNVG